MNYEASILYAMQRMREIGKTPDEYHFEPLRFVPSVLDIHNGYSEIKAYNELYLLINPKNYYGLFILSDNSAYNSDDMTQTGSLEFTGAIKFIKSAALWNFEKIVGGINKPIPVEFLRVLY